MADRDSSRRKRKTTQFRVILVWIIILYFLKYLSHHMHFITNEYKRFLKTNSTDPRHRVPLKFWSLTSQSVGWIPTRDTCVLEQGTWIWQEHSQVQTTSITTSKTNVSQEASYFWKLVYFYTLSTIFFIAIYLKGTWH